MTPYPFFGILLIMEGELFPKQKGCDPEIASLLFRRALFQAKSRLNSVMVPNGCSAPVSVSIRNITGNLV